MDEQNPWWRNESDHIIEEWESSDTRWVPALLDRMSLKPFSLDFIFGPRQVGKTTALKLLVRRELENRDPFSIFYYSCDELTGHKELGEVIDDYMAARNARKMNSSLILLDEITMVRDWWRAIKARVDRGVFRKDIVVVTGSASMELSRQKELFPGRRGRGTDHLLLPLSFPEVARIVGGLDIRTGGVAALARNSDANRVHRKRLSEMFTTYLTTGGFPRSVKGYAATGRIPRDTKKTYLDWARNDWGRAGRSDAYMKEVLAYILRARGTPVSWNGLASRTSINSPHTARSYVETLEGLFIAHVLPLMSQNGRIEHRKHRKLHLTDPLLHSIFSDYTHCEVLTDTVMEAAVASHVARLTTPYYYSDRSGEVDVTCRVGKATYGFEASTSVKKRKRKPFHMKELFVLDRENAPVLLASLGTDDSTGKPRRKASRALSRKKGR